MPVLRPHSLRADGYCACSGQYQLGVIVPLMEAHGRGWMWSYTAHIGPMGARGEARDLDGAKREFAACWRGWLERVGIGEGAAAFEDRAVGRLTAAPREGYPAQCVVSIADYDVGLISYWQPLGEKAYHPRFRCTDFKVALESQETLQEALDACDEGWRRWMALAGLRYVPRLELR